MIKPLRTGMALAGAALISGVPVAASAAAGDTLETVQERGSLNCTTGDGNFPGFFELDEKGKWHGLDIDYCRAVTTAIFGTDEKLTLVPVSWDERFPALQQGEVDLVIKATGWTMNRDTELEVQFSRPYFVGATTFMARKEIDASELAEVDGGVLCVAGGTSTERLVKEYIKQLKRPTAAAKSEYAKQRKNDVKLVMYENADDLSEAYTSGRCDVYAEWGPSLAATRAGFEDPNDHRILEDTLALEPESVAMREGDEDWVDLVNWVIAALQIAEEHNITSENVDEMKANPPNTTVGKLLGVTPDIGSRLGLSDDWAYNVIKIVGNAEEIYDRSLGKGSGYKLDRGLNGPWQKGGLFYPPVLD